MKRLTAMWGFTVIESMIFLSIAGFVFVGAAAGYGQRQRQVEFSQGVRDFQAQLQDLMNDVSTGFYPVTTASCQADDSNTPPYFTTAVANSSNCVWLGKAIQLGARPNCNINSPSLECSRYVSYPIVARRNFVDPSGNKYPVDSFGEAKPIALNTCLIGSIRPCETRPNLSQNGVLAGSIGVYRIIVRDASGAAVAQTGAIAFTSALQRSDNSYGGIDKTNEIDLVYVPGTSTASEEVHVTNQIDTALNSTYANPANGITFCIKGAYDQIAAISIGTDRRVLDVVVQDNDRIDQGCR